MKERTAKDVIKELIDQADVYSAYKYIRSVDIRDDDDPRLLKENAENVGKLVQSLPESDRKLIENLTPEELESFVFQFGGYNRMRPNKVNKRIRGPVSLSGRLREEKDE